MNINNSSFDSDLAGFIDHTALKPEVVMSDVKKLCDEATRFQFASVCVNPVWVPLCVKMLSDTQVKVCTVVGFPLGANTTQVKCEETKQAVSDGAAEIDMVMNIGKFKDGDDDFVYEDIHEVVNSARPALVKVIIETCLLTDAEIAKASGIVKKAGAAFVKTSTGFNKAGATESDVQLMRKVVGADFGVKAAGGIRDRETALKMIKAGANRIGASASLVIIGAE